MPLPVAEFPNFDGLSRQRANADILRAPDGVDWNALVAEVLAHQTLLNVPTVDPEDGVTIWRDGTVLKVASSGG